MAINRSRALKLGVNTYNGEMTCLGVAEAFDLPYMEL
jgi:alanine dehydrogenase